MLKGPTVIRAELAFLQSKLTPQALPFHLSLKESSASCEFQKHNGGNAGGAQPLSTHFSVELNHMHIGADIHLGQSPTLPWPGDTSHNPHPPDSFYLLEMDGEQWCPHGQSLNIHLCKNAETSAWCDGNSVRAKIKG